MKKNYLKRQDIFTSDGLSMIKTLNTNSFAYNF